MLHTIGSQAKHCTRKLIPSQMNAPASFALPTTEQQAEFQRAKESLLQDPTENNPRVTALNWFPYQPGAHSMGWREIVITYLFLNSLAIQISAVAVRPELRDLLSDLE